MVDKFLSVATDLAEYDESALTELLGIRAKTIERDPSIAGDLSPKITYNAKFLGPLDDVKSLGLKILNRWNKELFNIVCGPAKGDEEDRAKIINALSLSEGAAIAAIIPILIGLGLAPTLAAVIAAIIVKRFLGSAIETLCDSWKLQIQ
jgi:hypothetical protein